MPRLIVVTGAGSGIGRATARRFAEHGDTVLLVGRRPEKLRATAGELRAAPAGPEVRCVEADLSDEAGPLRLRERAEALGRPVDAVLCCAGSAAPAAGEGGLKTVAAEWQDTYAGNVLTAVLTVEALAPLLADGASVVLFSSIAAYRGSAGTGAYGAAKAALHAYTHHLAARLGPRGVRVNAIAPGYVADTEFFGDRMTAAREALLVRQTALGRAGTPDDVAGLAHFLCAPEGAYITSQILQVNGGSQHGV
ncbi:SDR family oxidoreductase [Streptomyces sp. NPDC005876]|jgi:3-oxoacyl-[acyl-carrier protein] reductase|uniref:SDR family NAD(P)-dependent oxidoreductase n=1 Tax=unclassified Streptomyces TaxID=2593676 RepID=UPI0033FCA40D